jgi:hypothetical protein
MAKLLHLILLSCLLVHRYAQGHSDLSILTEVERRLNSRTHGGQQSVEGNGSTHNIQEEGASPSSPEEDGDIVVPSPEEEEEAEEEGSVPSSPEEEEGDIRDEELERLLQLLRNGTQHSGPDYPKPGFKTRITQMGMDYARNTAIELLMKALRKLKIPDQEETIGPAKVSVFNMNMTEFPTPDSALYPLPGIGLRLAAYELKPKMMAEYEAEIRVAWWKIYKKGVVEMVGRNLSFSLDFFIGRDIHGKPTIQVIDCEASGSMYLYFTGGWSEGLNIGSTIFRDNIRALMYTQMCAAATDEINHHAGLVLQKFKVSERIENEYELDFQLTQYPEFYEDAMESFHKGAIYKLNEAGERQEPPFSPPEIPVYHEHSTRMVYVYVTSFLLNSGFYAAYHSGKMAINITRDQIPEHARQYVTMTCENFCLGSVFPNIAAAYPNAEPMVSLYAAGSPHISFREGHVIFNSAINAELHITEDQVMEHILTISVNVTSRFKVIINGRKVTFNITDINPDAEIAFSKINIGNNFVFEAMVRMATESFLKPKLIELGARGIDLPNLPDVRFVNSEIILSDNSEDVLVLATDIYYDGQI